MPATQTHPPCVLIAESDPWVRDLLRDMLLSVRCDARLHVCVDGDQALVAMTRQPDLIIAARELAGIDGLDLLRTVRTRSRTPALPFILLSRRTDLASVREALPLHPTAYLSKPLDLEGLRRRLEALLLEVGQQIACPVPLLQEGLDVRTFLTQQRTTAEGAPVFLDLHQVIKQALTPHGLDLAVVAPLVEADPQATAVLVAAANSASLHREAGVQSLAEALTVLGGTQSMNLMLGMSLKRGVRLSDPLLIRYAETYRHAAVALAEQARALARALALEEGPCQCAGLLHCLGELAVLRSLQEWRLAGGPLEDADVGQALRDQGAAFGSALRARWRLPLGLRELIAATYQLGGGVYSRALLVMHLARELIDVPAEHGLERVAQGRTARLLKLEAAALERVRVRLAPAPALQDAAPVADVQDPPVQTKPQAMTVDDLPDDDTPLLG